MTDSGCVQHFKTSTAYVLFTFALGQITDTFEGGICVNISDLSIKIAKPITCTS